MRGILNVPKFLRGYVALALSTRRRGLGNHDRRRRPVFHSELFQDSFHVLFDRSDTSLQDDADFRIRFSFGHPACNLFGCDVNVIFRPPEGLRGDELEKNRWDGLPENFKIPVLVKLQNRLLQRAKILLRQSHQLCVLHARIRRFTYFLKTFMC